MKSPSLPTTVVPAWIVRVTPGLTLIRPSISQVVPLVKSVSAVMSVLISGELGVFPRASLAVCLSSVSVAPTPPNLVVAFIVTFEKARAAF